MSTPPLPVSVVIGTFNSERYLRETLDSVMAQPRHPLEIVVVDNLSRDRTLEIARSYGDIVRIHVMDHNCLPGVTRNKGMELARGKYIALLDSDDNWYPTKLEKQTSFMEAHPDIVLSHTYCHVVDERTAVQLIRHEGMLPPTGDCFRALLRSCFITLSSVILRRDVIMNEHVFFPHHPVKDRTGEELLFFLKLAKSYPFGLIEDVLVQYRRYGSSISGRIGWKIVPENAVVLETILQSPEYWEGRVSRREVLDNFIAACLNNCSHWRDRRDLMKSVFFAGWALRHTPFRPACWTALLKSFGRGIVR